MFKVGVGEDMAKIIRNPCLLVIVILVILARFLHRKRSSINNLIYNLMTKKTRGKC
jgi:uncharacterized membrane protein affecting hemolysin expression